MGGDRKKVIRVGGKEERSVREMGRMEEEGRARERTGKTVREESGGEGKRRTGQGKGKGEGREGYKKEAREKGTKEKNNLTKPYELVLAYIKLILQQLGIHCNVT